MSRNSEAVRKSQKRENSRKLAQYSGVDSRKDPKSRFSFFFCTRRESLHQCPDLALGQLTPSANQSSWHTKKVLDAPPMHRAVTNRGRMWSLLFPQCFFWQKLKEIDLKNGRIAKKIISKQVSCKDHEIVWQEDSFKSSSRSAFVYEYLQDVNKSCSATLWWRRPLLVRFSAKKKSFWETYNFSLSDAPAEEKKNYSCVRTVMMEFILQLGDLLRPEDGKSVLYASSVQ